MPWIQIKLDTQPVHAECLENLLMELGACAVTLQDAKNQPLYEPTLGSTPLWDYTTVIGLFDAQQDINTVSTLLKERSDLKPFPSYKIDIVEDKDWEREWMTHFHPMRFGRKLWVCPSWKKIPEPDAVNLMLDPGLAFGTGTHPTTALCLEWLDKQKNINDNTLIDYGCGSGILAIAALLLGANKTIAVDIDPQALEATISNAQRNNIAPERLSTFLPDKLPLNKEKYLVANILAGPLVNLAPTLAQLVEKQGCLALSGILAEQTDVIMPAYKAWFDLDTPIIREGWAFISGRRH